MAVTYPEFLAVMAGNLFMVLPSMSLDWTIRLFSELDTESSNTINSFRIAGNLIGVVIFSTISHFLGRRIALISGGLSLPVGIFIITLSGKKEILYYGHSVVGLSVGGVAAVLPIYLGEIAKKKSRGILQSTILLSSTIGEFLSLCIVQFSSYQVHKLLLVVTPLLCSVIFFVLGIETPHFHVKNNRENIAKAVLVKLREATPHEIDKELEEIQGRSLTAGKEKILTCFKSNGWLKSLLVLLGLNVLQVVSAINWMMLRAHYFFREAGINLENPWIMGITGCLHLLGSLTCALMIDWFGRKMCLLVSTFGVILSLLPMAIYFTMKIHDIDVTFVSFIPFISLILFIVFYNIGIGPIPQILLGELFSPRFKMVGVAVVILHQYAINIGCNFITLMDFENLYISICCCGVALILIQFCIPETKGKSLHEIQLLLNRM